MWKVTLSRVTILVCLLVQIKATPDISLEDLLERLVTLEDWKRETEYEVASLRETVEQQGASIKNLERELAIQTNITATLQAREQEKHEDTQEHSVDKEDKTKAGEITTNRITAGYPNIQTPTLRKREIAGGVAFSAYLDHSVNPGAKQTIKFNQIITNDGNAYSIHTGAFTCPEAGVYLFSFTLGERSETDVSTQIWAELVVNSQHVVGAVVETRHAGQDLQGGNTVAVRLNQGDAVWIDANSAGEHVEGRENVRITTFTGVYLYA